MSRVQMTPNEYLAFERASDERHGYVNGKLLPMAHGTYEHSLLVSNVVRELSTALSGHGCDVHGSDLRIKVPAVNGFLYADASVVCGTPIFGDDSRDSVLNPKLIVEVLSDATERHDRGEKFAYYRSIDSLRDYVLVASKVPLIEHFSLQADGAWRYRALEWGERLELPSLSCSISVARVYVKVFRSGRVVVGTAYRTAEDEELLDATQGLYEEWMRKTEAVGFAEGLAQGLAQCIGVVYEARFGTMPPELKTVVEATKEGATLLAWLQLVETSSAEVFATTVLASRAS